jgi:putative oxygen-independent coproporphyrinogen III oxidase
MPWCVRKCPYCDFNSHGLRGADPDHAAYVDALIDDLEGDLADFGEAVRDREISSVFFGGGTPSLFPATQIARLLEAAQDRLRFSPHAEITLETNPGTVEHGRFGDYRVAGVNRISFGVQSFDDDMLRRLGRIHSASEAERAFGLAREAGFDNINLDLMYALPEQDVEGALHDLDRALALGPEHISHYQLTLEPNTAFAARPPPLPDEDAAWDMQEACQARLAAAGYAQYEVSAYAQPGRRCAHNLNYWRFGDYLGIGAGAHGKITVGEVPRRRWKARHPNRYLQAVDHAARIGDDRVVPVHERAFEYMLNALRLIDGTPLGDFSAFSGLPLSHIAGPLEEAVRRGWLEPSNAILRTTPLGQRFLNDVITLFMEPNAGPG